MSFPYMNAKQVSGEVTGSQSTVTPVSFISGQYNLFSVPGVVDASAMEATYSAVWSGGTTRGATTGNATIQVNITDGGPTGDVTGIANLHAILNNKADLAFAINVPEDVAGTALTDLDADDWVNFHSLTAGTGPTNLGVVQVGVAYIYGKPAGIN